MWQYTTYNLKEGPEKWDEIKEELADRIEVIWKEYAPNMKADNILSRYVHTPLDISREMISMFKGSMVQGGMIPNQMGIFRPFKSAAIPPYRTPIKNLYMCGCCTHPTGGLIAAPGYNAANAISEDLKIKKWWKPFVPEV
ncbi:MAG: hypothetical protein SV062_02345 [Thermodesulfobacteriota bacterium]|nr:hypothetical protein [Thermodesulfobacteriota bacterium]